MPPTGFEETELPELAEKLLALFLQWIVPSEVVEQRT